MLPEISIRHRFAGPALLLGALLALVASEASAQGWFNEASTPGYDFTGPYAQFGFAVGQINYDEDEFPVDVDSGASGGFILGGGYRIFPWLAADANFTFLAGEDNAEAGNLEGDAQTFAFTFGPKIYPFGLYPTEVIPDYVQPYGLIAIGGGEGEVDGPGALESEEGSFVARFAVGFDIWANEHLGFFVEGGGFAVEEDTVEGIGVFSFGAQYRF